MGDAAAEMLAKEMQAIVAADRWKGRDLSAAPPEKWSHLRPETQQFWIDTAARILAALPAAPAEDVRAGALKEAFAAILGPLSEMAGKSTLDITVEWKDGPHKAVFRRNLRPQDVLDLIPGAKP